ncbi:pyrroline-5-carboxylate reductase [Levilactobacillus bambusae]|uniref:Pyrroline-5-carboxylate reductase n=1 Tax=Levilactobacillus bambusae TaxID=2024736 RepID=A0A2V1MWB7_9LACO|nr:pyrroline-5-carboxylate reductase [Levilactobacillus bambusae]PWF99348.1 pyrroline-5-carboxylate reductase [Levilactobacillus bambusae]
MKIGFIGVGAMAKAIIQGLLNAKTFMPADIVIHSAHTENYEPYAKANGLTAAKSNREVTELSDLVVVAVVPELTRDVLREVTEELHDGKKILISIVAGITLDDMESIVGYDFPILRTLPNINVEVGSGMTAIAYNDNLKGDDLIRSIGVFNALGETTKVPEDQFDVFSALAGSSPAFIDLFIDSMSRAGVKYGFNKEQATRIAAMATLGSAKMMLMSHKIPFDLIDQVSSPGGRTVKGILAMQEYGLPTAVVKGIDATVGTEPEDKD